MSILAKPLEDGHIMEFQTSDSPLGDKARIIQCSSNEDGTYNMTLEVLTPEGYRVKIKIPKCTFE